MAEQISEEDLKQWERCFTPGTKAGYAGPEFVLRLIAAYRAQAEEIERLREENARMQDISLSIREDNKRLRAGMYHGVRVEVIQGNKMLQLVNMQTDGFNLIRAFVAEEPTRTKAAEEGLSHV